MTSPKIKTVRNLEYHPFIDEEGIFVKPLPVPKHKIEKNHYWFDGIGPFERLFLHHTLNSARRFAPFKRYPKIATDSLDFLLSSNYVHGKEQFPEKVDIYLQKETVGEPTFRRLRNRRDLTPERKYKMDHPLYIGGLKEKISPHSVKLICSGNHTPLTNPGYCRQEENGNYFYY